MRAVISTHAGNCGVKNREIIFGFLSIPTSGKSYNTATMSAMDLDAPVSIAPQYRAEQTNAT